MVSHQGSLWEPCLLGDRVLAVIGKWEGPEARGNTSPCGG